MASYSGDFPFGIMDVLELLQISVRRRSPHGVYADCPFCNDRRGKMHVHAGQNTWHCNYCKEGGGMLALYAKQWGITTSDAYREICEALMIDNQSWESADSGGRKGTGDSERGSSGSPERLHTEGAPGYPAIGAGKSPADPSDLFSTAGFSVSAAEPQGTPEIRKAWSD